jgi:rhodanese-related sulfurtransferase
MHRNFASLLRLSLMIVSLTALTACKDPSSIVAVPLTEPASAPAAGGIRRVDAPTFQQLHEKLGGILLDVRTPGETARARIAGASLVDLSDPRFEQRISLMQKDKPVFVYCASGSRSTAASRILQRHGFGQVYDLGPGLMGWMRAGLPVERGASADDAAAQGMEPSAFDALLAKDKVVLVDFHTPWCAPCRKMAPVVDDMAKRWQGRALVTRVDVESSEALAAREHVEGVPLFVLYVGGKEQWRKSGEQSREALDAELQRALTL